MTDYTAPATIHDPLEGRYAGFWVKVSATIIDLVLSTPFYLGIRLLWGEQHPVLSEITYIALLLCGYATFFASKWQATPGMRIMKVYACDQQGQRLTRSRTITWVVVSSTGFAMCLFGIIYMQMRFDLAAVLQLLKSCAEENVRIEDCAVEVETLIGIPYETFSMMSISSLVLALFLLLIWSLSVALAKDKSGFHNLICRTRFLRGRL